MSRTNSIRTTKKNDTIVQVEPSFSVLMEKFKHADSITSRDVEQYVDMVVERLAKIDSAQEAEKILENAVDFSIKNEGGGESVVASLEKSMKHGIITDFAVEKLDDLVFEVHQEEAEQAKKKLELADTDRFTLADEEDFDGDAERKKAEEEYADTRYGFDKLRQAVKEKLIEKLSLDPRLESWKKTGIHFFEKVVSNDKKHIKIVSGLDDNKRIMRDDRLLGTTESAINFAKYSPEEKNNYRRAIETIRQLVPNKHIIDINAFDDKNAQQIVPFKKFTPLNELAESSELRLSTSLNYMLDAVRGALYLEKNGIGLQDIALHNISVISDDTTGEKFGALTDLEGVYPLNEKLKNRLVAVSSAPDVGFNEKTVEVDVVGQLDNLLEPKSLYFPPEAATHKTFQASEMVFQFGVSLKNLSDELALNLKLRKSGAVGRALANEWSSFLERTTTYEKDKNNPLEKRLTLQELETGLASFVEKFEKMGL